MYYRGCIKLGTIKLIQRKGVYNIKQCDKNNKMVTVAEYYRKRTFANEYKLSVIVDRVTRYGEASMNEAKIAVNVCDNPKKLALAVIRATGNNPNYYIRFDKDYNKSWMVYYKPDFVKDVISTVEFINQHTEKRPAYALEVFQILMAGSYKGRYYLDLSNVVDILNTLYKDRKLDMIWTTAEINGYKYQGIGYLVPTKLPYLVN